MTARRVPMADVGNRVGPTWVADLSKSAAAELGALSFRLITKAQARNAMKEASARHYAAANYR